jgi:6-phosphofructokinase
MKHINFVTTDDMPLVQMVVVTINGTRYGLVGPVVHVPGTMDQDLDVSEIEFGEIMPAHAAAKMLQGEFRKVMGTEVQ